MFLAAAAEPDKGWGGPIALLVAVGLVWIGVSIHQRYLSVKGKPLPQDGEGLALEGVKPQVTVPSGTELAPAGEGSPAGGDDLDGFIASRVGKARTMKIVTEVQRHFGVSRRTALRAIGRARGSQS